MSISLLSTPRSFGFTLVELIVVIMLLGILSIGSVRFITDAADGFVSGSNRAKISGEARLIVHRMSQALREALPNSIRVTTNGECLEYVPVINASTYETAPIGHTGTSMLVAPFDPAISASTWRTAIAPGNSLYNIGSPGAVSATASVGGPNADNLVPITFSATHQFASASPQQRVYIITNPVSYCISGTTLYRYENYGFQSSQPAIAGLPTTLPDRSIVAANVQGSLPFFSTSSATLTRNAVVSFAFALDLGDDQLDIDHSVQIRNQI